MTSAISFDDLWGPPLYTAGAETRGGWSRHIHRGDTQIGAAQINTYGVRAHAPES